MKKKYLLLLTLLLFIMTQTAQADDTKLIAITFDDGPSKYTSGLLDELAKRQAVVTFFMQGCNAERYASVVQKAYEAGHQIASHTYNHPYLTRLSKAERQSQLSRTTNILNTATGADAATTYMLRPPYGSYNAQVLAQINTPAILWSVDTLDWKSRDADAVYQSIVENSRDGSIVLMHDLYPSTITGALRGIDYLQAQGYELVTVRELLRRRGVSVEPGKSYNNAYLKSDSQTLPALAAPQISYDTANNQLTLTANATIFYSLNNAERTVYTTPLPITSLPLEIRAFAALDLNGGRSAQSSLLVSRLGNCFADVRLNSWYYEDVDRAVAAGLLTTNNNYFYPDLTATEQTAAVLIQRITNNPLTAAAASAADNQPLTKQRLAQMLHQAQQLVKQPVQPLVRPDANGALRWAVEQGIFTNEANPTASLTRAELAAVILRCSFS